MIEYTIGFVNHGLASDQNLEFIPKSARFHIITPGMDGILSEMGFSRRRTAIDDIENHNEVECDYLNALYLLRMRRSMSDKELTNKVVRLAYSVRATNIILPTELQSEHPTVDKICETREVSHDILVSDDYV